ncbi:MAG TPA: isoprenylcysteine carboxylmethyltransferase family protein, partial [Microthrixaceae bacterium]|nr:isoprenylcysteine carboxylmethyltransferase family protein [Microthrixaceae bacterium]
SFRVADTASGARHLRRSLAQLVVFWTTFFVVVPLVLAFVEQRLHLDWTALDHWSVRFFGATAFILGSALGLRACVTMALRGHGTPLPAQTARDLVITGPYRSVRNPMAVAGALQTVGVGLAIGSWMVVAVALAGALAWNVLIRPVEEADLAARFGEPYRQYAEQVRCWVPTRPRA